MHALNIRLLTLGAFLAGTAELVIAGILNAIAEDLHISIALAGQLVTAYSLAFAIGTPIVVAVTARVGRKHLLVGALAVFMIGCLASFGSSVYGVLLLSRVILGLSAGVFTVVAFSSVVKLVPPDQIGSAVGTVALGISSAMVLGVPIGAAITNWWSWQHVFMGLAIVSLIVMLGIIRYLSHIEGDAQVPFKQQFAVLRNPIIVSGFFLSLFFSTSCSIMYAYMTPFLSEILHMKASSIGIMLLVLGICSVIGSRLGGIGVDKWGSVRVIVGGLLVLAISLALLPLFAESLNIGVGLIIVWISAMSITIPAIQTYFIQQAPQSANLVLGLNSSILHLGVALGAGVGGLIVEVSSTVLHNPWVASGTIALSLLLGLLSFSLRRKRNQASTTA